MSGAGRALLAAALVLVAACGEGGDDSLPPPAELTAYRYETTLDVTLDAPLGEQRITGTKRGAFVAPDRHEVAETAAVDGQALPGRRVVIIGDRAWFDGGGGYAATDRQDPNVVAAVADFTSVGGSLLPGGDVYDSVAELAYETEAVGPYTTRRFTADLADPDLLAAFTGQQDFDFAAADAASLSVWIDEATGLIVRTRLALTGGPGVLGGDAAGAAAVDLALTVELSDVNDPAVAIEPPG